MQRDPLIMMQNALIEAKIIDEETIKKMDKQLKEQVIAAMKFAEESPWPDPLTLEEDVYAP